MRVFPKFYIPLHKEFTPCLRKTQHTKTGKRKCIMYSGNIKIENNMKKIYSIIVILFVALSMYANTENASTPYGIYKGKVDIVLKKNKEMTTLPSRQFTVEVKQGSAKNDVIIAVTGYEFGGVTLDRFEIPGFTLNKKENKWYIIQESNVYVTVTAGSKEFQLLVLSDDSNTYATEDGTINLDIAFAYNNHKDEYTVYSNIFKGQKNDVKTGIGKHTVVESRNSDTIYDLNGRQVKNAKNGIFIVNGKKVFIK